MRRGLTRTAWPDSYHDRVPHPQDPFDERPSSARRISQVTRRDIFDYLRTRNRPWWGRITEIGFLNRLYDLESMPSTDTRFTTASRDIAQHRVANYDWEDDWIFDDPRFSLASGPDEYLLDFIAQIVHPVVLPDVDQAAQVTLELNQLLAPDGWALKPRNQISGRPIYAPERIEQGVTVLSSAHEVAARIDTQYVAKQVTRMEGSLEGEPDLAIGTAKEFVETICKTILDERNVTYGNNDDIPSLVRKTAKTLQLTPSDVPDHPRSADTVKRMLMSLATLVQGSAELRNAYGTGHGRSQAEASLSGLLPRHARLAVGSATTLGVFLYETHEARK